MNPLDPNFVLDACRWHVDAEAHRYKKRALDHFRDRYTVLLSFFREEGLLADDDLWTNVPDWYHFELRRRDLTAEGNALFKLCTGTWNPAFGQGHTKRHLVQWKRRLNELRRDSAGTRPVG